MLCDLLEWSGEKVAEYHDSVDLQAPRHVVWASYEPVPACFDLVRSLAERWVHQQQIRLAVGKRGHHAEKYLPAVIGTFVWAFPHQYVPVASAGTQVLLEVTGIGVWILTHTGSQWELDEGSCESPTARVVMSRDAAWRSLTGAVVHPADITKEGPVGLTDAVVHVRGIIV